MFVFLGKFKSITWFGFKKACATTFGVANFVPGRTSSPRIETFIRPSTGAQRRGSAKLSDREQPNVKNLHALYEQRALSAGVH